MSTPDRSSTRLRGAPFVAVVITVVPVLVVYLIFQRRLEGSVSQGTFR